jgi:hypothetical protein
MSESGLPSQGRRRISKTLYSFAAEDRTQFSCVRCIRARKNNECSGAGSFSARPPPDNLSLSVIGTISIPKTGFNNTFGSSRQMYQCNKQSVEPMPTETFKRRAAAVCALVIHRRIGNDSCGASRAGATAQYVTTTMMVSASAPKAAHCAAGYRPFLASSELKPLPSQANVSVLTA